MNFMEQLKECGRTYDQSEPVDLPKLFAAFRKVVEERALHPEANLIHFAQWRFPRSKKKRIQRKWAYDYRNWRRVIV